MVVAAEAQDAEDEAVDLRVYLSVLGRRWKVIAAVAVFTLAASVALSLTQATRYRATADLLIRPSSAGDVISEGQSVNVNEAARLLNNEVQLFESEAVEKAVDDAYDGPLKPGEVNASVVSDASDVVRATLTSSNSAEGAKLVNLYVATFIDVRRTQQVDELLKVGVEIQTKIDDLQARITTTRAPLDEIDRRLANDPGDPGLTAQRENLAQSLAATLTPLESRRSFFQSQLEELDLTTEVISSSGAQLIRSATAKGAVSPTPTRDAAIALVLGLVLGVGIAFLVDTLDERIRGSADLERISGGLPTLALVPESPRSDPGFVAARDDSHSVQAEAFRGLRTALKFAAIDRPFRVVQVTSPTAGEGKTTTVANLAVAIAQAGDRVAVVCCDLRRPRLHERMQASLTPGLTDVLLGDVDLTAAVQRTPFGVYVVPAGSPPPNPSELLSTEKAAAVIRSLAQEVDIVILDCPPVLPVTDALVVSRLADATVVVADSRSTERRAIRRTLQQLQQVGAPVVGIVLNGLPEGGEYGYGYGYGGRYISGPNKDGKGKEPKDPKGSPRRPAALSVAAPTEEAARRRTFAIISHPDAGKTTLTEKFLLYGGALQSAGAVKARGERRRVTSDWMEMEQKRGISITSTVLQFPYRDSVLNLLDTPGHRDFSEDTYRVLAAADAAVMVLDAAKGIEPQTLKLFEVCRERNLPLLTFINKWDRPGRDPLELLDQVEQQLSIVPTPVTWPVGIAGDFRGVVDRSAGRYVRFTRTARGATEAGEEERTFEQAAAEEGAAWEAAWDELSLLDEVGAHADPERFRKGEVTPVFFGSALTNFGVRILLDAVIDQAPSPTPRDDVDGLPRSLDAPFSAFVFKVQANMDPSHRDRIAFVRVCSGRFERGMVVTHGPTGKPFATKYAHAVFGQERDTIEEAWPGDVVGLVNATDVTVGDALYDGPPVEFPRLPEFAPEHFVVARVKDTGRFKQFRRGIAQLDEEGVVQVLRDQDLGDQAPILAAVGPMQFEVAAHRLEHEFGAPTELNQTSWRVARKTDEASTPTLRGLQGVAVYARADGTRYALFESPYWLARVEGDHPDLTLERLVAEGTAG